MKLRITYRKQAEHKIEVSVDTDIKSDPVYSSKYQTDETAISGIKHIIKAARVQTEAEIVLDKEFGDFTFESPMDFNNEKEYTEFCASIILSETNTKKKIK